MIQTPIISQARVQKLNITQSSGSDSGLKHSHPESWYTTSENKSSNTNSPSSYSSDDEASQSKNNNKNNLKKKFQSWKQKITGNTPKKQHHQQQKTSIPENNIFSQKRGITYIDSSATSSMTSVCDNQQDFKEYIETEVPVGRFGNLGITVIGQTTPDGHDVGIYCGGIVQNSAAASIGQIIEVGDRLVMVDGEDLRHMPNDYAVEVLQQRVTNCLLGRSGRATITLGLAKYMDQQNNSSEESSDSATEILDSSNDENNFHQNFVKPINPAEWVANHEDFYISQQNLHKIQHHHHHNFEDTPSVDDSDDILTVSEERESTYETLGYDPQVASHKKLLNSLSIQTSMRTMVKTASERGSGLKIKDREWFKLIINNAFLGADLVDWLHENVTGLEDRRDAKQYAATLFKGQLVKPTIQARIDKFSEKSYYKF